MLFESNAIPGQAFSQQVDAQNDKSPVTIHACLMARHELCTARCTPRFSGGFVNLLDTSQAALAHIASVHDCQLSRIQTSVLLPTEFVIW